jgi:hypothetical protein
MYKGLKILIYTVSVLLLSQLLHTCVSLTHFTTSLIDILYIFWQLYHCKMIVPLYSLQLSAIKTEYFNLKRLIYLIFMKCRVTYLTWFCIC